MARSSPYLLSYIVFACIGLILVYIIRQDLNSSVDVKIAALRSELLSRNDHSQLGLSPLPLPSIIIEPTAAQKKDKYYGGKGDKEHLGGWALYDPNGVSNMTWDYMIGVLGVRSFLDIGCGRGYSTKHFLNRGARVLCIEGSQDAIDHTLLPSKNLIVAHDFTRGAYWPSETFDACWSVEFLEHVSRKYFQNYVNAFRRCALIFITASGWGGYHHVEVHDQSWWIGRFSAAGFMYSEQLSRRIMSVANSEMDYIKDNEIKLSGIDPRDEAAMKALWKKITPNGQHVRHGMMAFYNPLVSALPIHDHLFNGEGCYNLKHVGNADGGRPCQGEDALTGRYLSLLRCYKDMEKAKAIGKNVEQMYWTCVSRDSNVTIT